MKKKSLVFLSAAAALTLAACGSANNSNTSSEASKASSKSKFNAEVTHEGTAIKGGTLKYALVAASPQQLRAKWINQCSNTMKTVN